MRLISAIPLLLPLLLLGCAGPASTPPSASREYLPVKGQAVITEIHPELNYLMMKTADGVIKGWWNENSRFFAGPVQTQTLALKPGDKIQYFGVLAYNEIYIRQLIQPH